MRKQYDCIGDFVFYDRPTDSADVILVPGGSHGQLMEKAVELYKKGVSQYILPSGGPNNKLLNYSTEFDFLKQITIDSNVPECAILKEDRAKNTFENAELSYKVLMDNRVVCNRALIVCKAYHARRALLTYSYVFPKSVDFYVCPIVDRRGITRDSWQSSQETVNVVMGEVMKIGSYFKDKVI